MIATGVNAGSRKIGRGGFPTDKLRIKLRFEWREDKGGLGRLIGS
jgi:hypothetical protein